jgi:hypothetical protein
MYARDIVWPAVLAVLFAVVTIAVALFVPDSVELVVALSSAAVTMALLAQRA